MNEYLLLALVIYCLLFSRLSSPSPVDAPALLALEPLLLLLLGRLLALGLTPGPGVLVASEAGLGGLRAPPNQALERHLAVQHDLHLQHERARARGRRGGRQVRGRHSEEVVVFVLVLAPRPLAVDGLRGGLVRLPPQGLHGLVEQRGGRHNRQRAATKKDCKQKRGLKTTVNATVSTRFCFLYACSSIVSLIAPPLPPLKVSFVYVFCLNY